MKLLLLENRTSFKTSALHSKPLWVVQQPAFELTCEVNKVKWRSDYDIPSQWRWFFSKNSIFSILLLCYNSGIHLFFPLCPSPSHKISGLNLFLSLQCLSLLVLELYAGSGQLGPEASPLILWMGFTHQVYESHSCKPNYLQVTYLVYYDAGSHMQLFIFYHSDLSGRKSGLPHPWVKTHWQSSTPFLKPDFCSLYPGFAHTHQQQWQPCRWDPNSLRDKLTKLRLKAHFSDPSSFSWLDCNYFQIKENLFFAP